MAAILAASSLHSVLWAQDGVGKGGTPILRSAPIPLDDDLTIIIPIERNIPPDPGVVGETTLAGMDTDKDGVRDDLEREVVRLYPNNAKARASMYEIAKQYQLILLNSTSPNLVRDSNAYILAWSRCLQVATGDSGATAIDLEAQAVNTEARAQAYFASMHGTTGNGNLPVKVVTCP